MTHSTSQVDRFIERWTKSGAAERANYQLFLTELCSLLDVPHPEPTRPDDAENAYVFERNVHFQEDDGTQSIGRIDLYKRGAFLLEAKQGSDAATDDETAVLQPPAGRPGKPKSARAKPSAQPKAGKHAWPKGRAAQAKAVFAVLRDCPAPVTGEELAQRFARAPRETIDELLGALVALGQVRRTRGGKYTS